MVRTVITFGRFNPFTSGHKLLGQKVISEAKKRNAVPMIFMSHSQDKKKNPLSYDQKIKIGQKVFGNIVKKSKAKTIIEVLQSLSGRFDEVVLVVGSDRVDSFKTLLERYNGKEYNFKSIEVISAGERDPDADDVTGMSASKMREFASKKDLPSFKKGLPTELQRDAEKIYNDVRAGMNLKEGVNTWLMIKDYLSRVYKNDK